ncbi:MAG: DUF188 domain-containing protein [Candidatus Anstonellaceae archaeon]
MKKIVADTNFLLMPFEYGVDLAGELQRIVQGPLTLQIPSVVFAELRMLEGKTGKNAAAARFFLQNLEKFRSRFAVEEVESSGAADEWILKYAQKNSITVATNDIPLRKRLLALGVPVIAMKGKSKLDFV